MTAAGPFAVVWLAAFAALTRVAFAHGDLHEQIAGVTAQIEKGPAGADLYVKRAELHRLHEDWLAAAADYDRADTLAPNAVGIQLGRGRMFLAIGRFDDAKAALDKCIAEQPEQVDALVTRARVEVKRQKPEAAAEDFARALALTPLPEPDLYLERARALASVGDDHLATALACLDEGTAKLGNLPTLGLYAIELEVRRKQFDAALVRLDKLSAGAARKEAWRERRGDILTAAGRSDQARQAYLAAYEAIRALPTHRRQTKAMDELEKRIKRKTGQ